ncbi:prolipoprotein diacylglyceryl transferase [Pseudobacteroides cellulosolvens]|uniref:Prolipoprotein diacylglyceryl transferase n=2 Tax=Pseudobacteroides cellulosolvens TaxID=35825 RepID=A0A0L6JGU0_9FIRM|nr:prolipoprotein diacylglyceryl transferase family protein [Pseudobacteroides cellulosolvens]KNY24934.1 prolipoprotein diacylglyceryl transferase [Pseudobacteroides cellulosolvens ATCC 35603 = DSM 2933]
MTGNVIQEYLSVNFPNLDPKIPVHPTFLYESLWNFGVFAFLIWFRKRKKSNGEVFFLYLILYGVGRMWIEGLRLDSLMLGSTRISQIISICCIILGIAAFIGLRKMKNDAVLEAANEPSSYSTILEELKNRDNDSDEHGIELNEEQNDKNDDENNEGTEASSKNNIND